MCTNTGFRNFPHFLKCEMGEEKSLENSKPCKNRTHPNRETVTSNAMGDIPFHIVLLHLASTERTADISRAQRSKLRLQFL